MARIRKRDLFILIYFTILAISVANCTTKVQGNVSGGWGVGQQLQYLLPGNDPQYANKSTFLIVDINAATGDINR